ncbi:hypothetical protein PORY_002602 [Pneumocystis oryctolagi]|uniref:Uncharacterized protein n=1 Tax=Pneumocystis oryctolagi TaxID=42067 RepID=A0ACB7CG62_9ASCO|nr:hypothetical protein PORY_002602 [Pneumocystis oryctolagi]
MYQDEHFLSPCWEASSYEASVASSEEPSAPLSSLPANVATFSHSSNKEPTQLLCFCKSPRKEALETKDMHISYLTNMPMFQNTKSAVRRRFTDFVFLYETLSSEFPMCCVPPLPDKHRLKYIKGDRFNTEFTTKRAKSLEIFLQRLAMHPQLRQSHHLCQFLESQDWHAYVRSVVLHHKINNIHVGNVLEGLSDVFLNAFTKLDKPNQLFIDMKEKIDKLDNNLTHIEKLVSKMVRNEVDLESNYNRMALLFKQLSILEPSLSQELIMFSEAIENTEANIRTLRKHTDYVYLTSLHDLISYASMQKQLLKQRDQKQMDIEGLSSYLLKINLEKQQVIQSSGLLYFREKIESLTGIDHEKAKQDRLKKLDEKNEEIKKEIEISKQASQAFDEETIQENKIFNKIKEKEIKENFSTFVKENIRFYKQILENWEKIVPQLELSQQKK